MDITTTIILLLLAIVISNLLDSAFPKLPLPMIQIIFGVLITLTPFDTNIDLNPELFMGLLIAPLLFREAEEADLFALWKVRKEVIILVFGLVLLTVFAIGFSVNFLLPSLPFAACCALGAILGPTDAIAVSSVSSRIDIDKNVMNALRGEWLVNDATGVISFNFAVLALVTGSFSILSVGASFLLLCVGGFVLGFVLILLKSQVVLALKRYGIGNNAAFMLIEILMPFLCFFIAEELGLSGIIAAVTAGSRQSLKVSRLNIYNAEFSIFKKSFWEIIVVSINSFVFILLGMHLPNIIRITHQSAKYSVTEAMIIALLVTVILFLVRFFGTLFASHEVIGEEKKEKLRNRLLLTFSGVKGTVSLATAFALPTLIEGGKEFAQRDFMLLITAFAILYSLIVAMVFLPLIARKKIQKKKNLAHIKVLKELVSRLEEGVSSGESNKAVLLHHKQRIRTLELEDYMPRERRLYASLRREFMKEEIKEIERSLKTGSITKEEYLVFSDILSLVESMQKGRSLNLSRVRFMYKVKHLDHIRSSMQNYEDEEPRVSVERLHEIFWANTGTIMEILKRNHRRVGEALLEQVVDERLAIAAAILERMFGDVANVPLHIRYEREIRQSFDIERTVVDEFVTTDVISLSDSDSIRQEINVMENYTIEDLHDDVAIKVLLNRSKKSRRTLKNRIKEIKNDEDLS